MSAKPAKRKSVETARPNAGPPVGANEAHDLLDALNAAFDPAGEAPAGGHPILPDLLWESGPPVSVRSLDGKTSYANPAYKEIIDALQAAGALTPADDLAAVIEGLGHPHTEELTLLIEGSPRFFLAWHELVRRDAAGAPHVASHYCPADDLGLRLRALETSDDRWHDLTRLITEIAWECSPEAVITDISPRVIHLLGYHPHDVIGRPWGFLAGDGDGLTARLLDPAGRAPFRGLELRLVDKDGKGRQFLIQGLPVFDRESGALTGFRGTAQDVTDYIENEAALLQISDSAEAANRAKSVFLANMSHELRTPLNAIIGFTEIMAAEEFGPIGNPRYLEYLKSVLDSSQHLLGLINQVLDVAKIESGKLELIEDSVDPGHLVRAALRVMSATAKRRGIALEGEITTEPVHLWADEGKLRQILLNLLSNSLKFTLKGGRIEVIAKPDSDGGFLLQVRDNGIGIDPEDFETVLTPFEQVDGHLTRRFEGTGLGLPLAKALAETHGGSLSLDSAVGEGTTVTVRLPPDRVRES